MLFTAPVPAMANISVSYQYNLSNFNGVIHSQWAKISADFETSEIYVINPGESEVRIFNPTGMEVYRFGYEINNGYIDDVAVREGGSILALSGGAVTLCNYRGEPVSAFRLKNLPPGFSGFRADNIEYRNGKVYLADSRALKIVVADGDGNFQKLYDIPAMLKFDTLSRKQKEGADMTGFSVGSNGDMLFTISVFFSAYRLSPDGDLEAFGRPGSGHGQFGIAAGIASDDRGNIYVADRLRCKVIVFDKDLNFIMEFGDRGPNPDNLVVPDNVVFDRGNLYISQAANRGVSVYRITQ